VIRFGKRARADSLWKAVHDCAKGKLREAEGKDVTPFEPLHRNKLGTVARLHPLTRKDLRRQAAARLSTEQRGLEELGGVSARLARP
jgi:hypothetical protein